MITLQKEGRRTYIVGNTYPLREQIRAIGAHWDAEKKAWWTSKHVAAEELINNLSKEQPAQPNDGPGLDSVVAGKARWNGKTYYMAGRAIRGRTRWDDSVSDITSKDGQKILLYPLSATSKVWAPRYSVEIIKCFAKPRTIGDLRKYAEEAKKGFPGRATCPMCGSPHCEGADGGLCEHD